MSANLVAAAGPEWQPPGTRPRWLWLWLSLLALLSVLAWLALLPLLGFTTRFGLEVECDCVLVAVAGGRRGKQLDRRRWYHARL